MGRWNARVTHVYDGDTFTATIENGPHQGLSIKVRVIGFNSEEIKDKRY
jgi:endonuclease YncB( thermonuclease family)